MTSTSRVIRFLSTAQIMRLYETHVTRASPTQKQLLDSAVDSPQNNKCYHGQNDVFQLAGILSERIILNHAYQDGNKRIALLAADMFLKINGFQLQERPFGSDDVNDGLKDAHVAIAEKRWTAKDLAKHYKTIAKPVSNISGDIQHYKEDSQQF